MSNCISCRPVIRVGPRKRSSTSRKGVVLGGFKVRACMLNNSSPPDKSSNFAKRIEQAWLISQQPTPISCSSCNSNGHVECKWCAGTGFFIIGDNMLCEIPSRNTTCVICAGEGSARCSDCQGTGFRAKWLGRPPIYSE
ncbi:hypothetical protein vseg_014100 [Gypsophila vaccaria]